MNTIDLRAALKAHDSTMRTLERKVRRLTAQRDAAIGKAREYRTYCAKYQRELVELKKELLT